MEKKDETQSDKTKKSNEVLRYDAWKDLPPALTTEESIELLKEYKKYGDIKVRDKLVDGSLRLVAYFVSHYGQNFINKLTSIEPSFEDLCQHSVIYLIKAIENFKVDYKFTFATYLQHALYRGYARYIRKPDTKLKLEDKFYFGGKRADDDGFEILDIVADPTVDIENEVAVKRDFALVKNKILPLLPSRDREIFSKIAIEGQTLESVGKLLNVSKEWIRIRYEKVLHTVSKMYMQGVSETDKALHGANVSQMARNIIENNIAMLKKYDKNYIEVYFPSKIRGEKTKAIYDICFLNYYGQDMNEIAKLSDVLETSISNMIKSIRESMELKYPTYLKETGKFVKTKTHRLSTQQKINTNERLLEQYGGKYFLYKYFMPTLSGNEQIVFRNGMLDYNGETQEVLAKKCDMTGTNFANTLSKVRNKLENTDFETVVDIIDRADFEDMKISKLSLDAQERARQRKAIVKKYGDKALLREYFLPMLPDNQKLLFDKMYLSPQVATYDDITKVSKMTVGSAISIEKIILNKLENFNLEEMIKIKKEAKKYFQNTVLDDNFAVQKSNRSSKVEKWGGRDFLEEKFIPTLLTESEKIIFRRYYFEGKKNEDILKELGMKKSYNYVFSVLQTRIKPKMKDFMSSFDDFEKAVVDFYAKKEYEKEHNEKFEKTTFVSDNNSLILQKDKDKELEKLIEKCGGPKEVVNNFMPKLNSITKQVIFVESILKKKKDKEVAERVGLSYANFRYEKTAVIQSFEKFANSKERKKD